MPQSYCRRQPKAFSKSSSSACSLYLKSDYLSAFMIYRLPERVSCQPGQSEATDQGTRRCSARQTLVDPLPSDAHSPRTIIDTPVPIMAVSSRNANSLKVGLRCSLSAIQPGATIT